MIETEAPAQYGFKKLGEAVRARRSIKDVAHESDISLGGSRGKKLDAILDTSEQILSSLRSEHADWIDQKRAMLSSYLLGTEPEALEETFSSGLATTVVQEFRTLRGTREKVNKLEEPDYLKDVISAYAFDFFRSLRLSEKMGINPNTALDVARLSYHLNPNKMLGLFKKYPDTNPGVITHAAMHNPKNPDAFIDNFNLEVERLTVKYPDTNPGVIAHAAMGYPKNPDAFLDKVLAGETETPEDEFGLTPTELEELEIGDINLKDN
ncbi:MAG: hypothetical protein Q7S45_00260 [Candidatus Curtissbacteria bacterium]|nr:hypothetical protein [Candidatus Curtissbacteria bacterium]